MTHCDIGLSPGLAYVLGEKPSIDYLCGNYDGGDSIRDGLMSFEVDGRLAVVVDCPLCKLVAELMYRDRKSLAAARREAQKLLAVRLPEVEV